MTVELYEIGHPVGTSVHAHTIFVLHGDRLDDFVQPVSIRIQDQIIACRIVLELRFVVVRSRSCDSQLVIIGMGVQNGISHVHQPRRLLQAYVIGKGDSRSFAINTPFGRNQDHAVRRSGTVDGA